ncbi:MAG: transglutaminase-like cysteine peptidase [Rhizobium sp.]|nr:transglutaminase-like cysteine peptidase [Rhizobium sp.]
MFKNKKKTLAVSTLVLATMLSVNGNAAPLTTEVPAFPSNTATLLYGLAPMPVPMGGLLAQGMSAGWQAASAALAYTGWSAAAVSGLVDQSLTTSAVSVPRSPNALPKPKQGSEDVFGSVAIPFKKLGALKKAAPTFAEIAKGTALRCDDQNCLQVKAMVQKTAAGTGMSSIRDKLNLVNRDINQRIKYAKDIDVHGKLDRWASPSETLKLGTGDCEDYALLKMAVLESQGIALSDMTVVILYDTKRHFYHAVLSVEVQGRHYILDNMRPQVLTDAQLPDYMPLFSISNGRGFLHGSKIKGKALAMKSFDGIAPGEGAEL